MHQRSFRQWIIISLAFTDAAIFTIPIYDQISSLSGSNQVRNSKEMPQKILPFTSDHDPLHSPIEDAALITYGLNVSIRTPPQSFRMLLDITWDTLFIQSSDCASNLCQSYNHTGFNSSASTSYSRSDDTFTLDYGYVSFEGYLARDTFSVAGLQIDRQPFLDAIYIWPRTFFHWYVDYDGVLGFVPNYTNNPWHFVPLLWQSIVSKNLLDHNVFSIRFPPGSRDFDKRRTDGELTIGGISPSFSSAKFIELSLLESNPTYSWHTTLQSLVWGDGKQLREDFDDGIAFFTTGLPYILLPGNWTAALRDLIGAHTPDGFFYRFHCDKRDSLPNLTFLLGGYNISLSAYEYSFELRRESMGLKGCDVAFIMRRDGEVGLGLPFLENFYSVFDQDEKKIKRKLASLLYSNCLSYSLRKGFCST